jgi:hypothetical protein
MILFVGSIRSFADLTRALTYRGDAAELELVRAGHPRAPELLRGRTEPILVLTERGYSTSRNERAVWDAALHLNRVRGHTAAAGKGWAV